MTKIHIAGVIPIRKSSENLLLRILNINYYGLKVILDNGIVYHVDFNYRNQNLQESRYFTMAVIEGDDKRKWQEIALFKCIDKDITLFELMCVSNSRG